MKNYIAAAGIILMLAAPALAKEKSSKISAADQAKRQAAAQNTLVVPGRSIGPISLGMGMDQVVSVLGQPDFNYTQNAGATWTTWKYISINLIITFGPGAAPSVTSIAAAGWTHGAQRMGDISWAKNVEAPSVYYATNAGVTLGTSSFAAIRDYAGQAYEDNTVWITFKQLGLSLNISTDHVVYGLTVRPPE